MGELLKCLQGSESSESCSNTRGRGPAEKVLAEQRFSKREDAELTAEFFLPSQKAECTADVLCVKKAQKESNCAFISIFF